MRHIITAALVIGALLLACNAEAKPKDQFFVTTADREILAMVPGDYTLCTGGICTPGGQLVIQVSEPGALEKGNSSAIKDYTDYLEDDDDPLTAYEAQVQAKIRQLAMDALAAEGIYPPAPERQLYLETNGKVTDVPQ